MMKKFVPAKVPLVRSRGGLRSSPDGKEGGGPEMTVDAAIETLVDFEAFRRSNTPRFDYKNSEKVNRARDVVAAFRHQKILVIIALVKFQAVARMVPLRARHASLRRAASVLQRHRR